jgi:hypothetical protein
VATLLSESQACLNQICGISIRVSTAKRIVEPWTHLSKCRLRPGQRAARSTGGKERQQWMGRVSGPEVGQSR